MIAYVFQKYPEDFTFQLFPRETGYFLQKQSTF